MTSRLGSNRRRSGGRSDDLNTKDNLSHPKHLFAPLKIPAEKHFYGTAGSSSVLAASGSTATASVGTGSGGSGAPGNGGTWKTYGMETEAGRRLARLYGRQSSVAISYPKLKTKKRPTGERPAWGKGDGSKASAAKAKKCKADNIHYPKFNKSKVPEVSKLEMLPRRKPHSEIQSEMERREAENRRFRPFPKKGTSTAMEKYRLQMKFQFEGGKALPDAALPTTKTRLPISVLDGRRAKRAVERKYEAAKKQTPEVNVTAELEDEFGRIAREIQQRAEFLQEAEQRGDGKRWEKGIKAEISRLTHDLKRVDKQIAMSMR